MADESNEWLRYGLTEDCDFCLRSAEELKDFINKVGFLPLFRAEIPGQSVEERTLKKSWWTGKILTDPWEWRGVVARTGEIAYGKFFGGRAGFISKEWLPYFINYRRDGYDFDTLYEDGKAGRRQKLIMDCFETREEIISNELRQMAGFCKDGEKNFDGTAAELQMLTYLCLKDFRQRKNKKGEEYGWSTAVYSTPEHVFGRDLVTGAYHEEPEESVKRIVKHILEVNKEATEEQVRQVMALKPEKNKKLV